jgi:hypothetical protein
MGMFSVVRVSRAGPLPLPRSPRPVSSPDRQPPQSDPANRRRARVLIPVGFVLAVVLVMLFIFLVHWLGK